jgi:phosphoribulokinase
MKIERRIEAKLEHLRGLRNVAREHKARNKSDAAVCDRVIRNYDDQIKLIEWVLS